MGQLVCWYQETCETEFEFSIGKSTVIDSGTLFFVRHTGDGKGLLGDTGQVVQFFLHLNVWHHLAADLTEAAQAVCDHQKSVLVHRGDVAGDIPAISQHLGHLSRAETIRFFLQDDLVLPRIEILADKALQRKVTDAIDRAGITGWTVLPEYDATQPLPQGVTALTHHVSVPEVLVRRMGQIGLVTAEEGARLQPLLKPGQRLVSVEGDLWRWDGYRAWAEDAPSAAALRAIHRQPETKPSLVGEFPIEGIVLPHSRNWPKVTMSQSFP